MTRRQRLLPANTTRTVINRRLYVIRPHLTLTTIPMIFPMFWCRDQLTARCGDGIVDLSRDTGNPMETNTDDLILGVTGQRMVVDTLRAPYHITKMTRGVNRIRVASQTMLRATNRLQCLCLWSLVSIPPSPRKSRSACTKTRTQDGTLSP